MKTQKKKVHIDLSLLLVSSELHQNKDEWNGNVRCHGSRKKRQNKEATKKERRKLRKQTHFIPLISLRWQWHNPTLKVLKYFHTDHDRIILMGFLLLLFSFVWVCVCLLVNGKFIVTLCSSLFSSTGEWHY